MVGEDVGGVSWRMMVSGEDGACVAGWQRAAGGVVAVSEGERCWQSMSLACRSTNSWLETALCESGMG